MKRAGLGLVAATAAALVWAGSVMAAGTGTTISPAFQQVDIPADSAGQSFPIKITNSSGQTKQYVLSVADFGALDESGGVAFIGSSDSDFEHKYGLSSWLELSTNQLSIAAGTTETITATVVNKQSLAPGGHYGAVLVKEVGEQQPADNTVQLQPEVSSLVLVTKEGGLVYGLKLAGIDRSGGGWILPRTVSLRLQNTGNVHVVPRGIVRILDPWGRVVASGIINDGSTVILPESFRKYDVKLTSNRPLLFPGRYRMVVQYRYDGSSKVVTDSSYLWLYAPGVAPWIIGALVLIGATAWWFWHQRRRPKKRPVRPSGSIDGLRPRAKP